ncbi:MAG: exo-alpha-sialidase [Planctomycetes bacterium]|nr:exo-alpha-sialidase [Planctomycetota bacterium]
MRVDIDRIGKMWARYSVWLAAAAVFVGWPMNPAWGQFKGDVAALNANAVADSGEDTNLQLATDAAGNWVAVWQSNDTLDDSVGGDLDIFVATSSDGGVTWSDPAVLNSDAATDAMDDFNPALVTDGTNWIVVWQCDMPGGGTVSNIHHSRSTDAGATWSPQGLFSTPNQQTGGTDADPSIATDGSQAIAVWSSTRDIDGNVDGDNVPILSFDADIFMSVSTDGGGSWTTASVVNTNHVTDPVADTVPSIATDGDSNWMIVWHSFVQIVFARSEDNGGTWSPLAGLPGSAGGKSPQIVSDFGRSELDQDAGVWLAAWVFGPDVVASRFIDTGPDFDLGLQEGEIEDVWREPVTVGAGSNPFLATDRIGTWIMTWQTSGEDGADVDVLFARSVNNGIDWMESQPLDDGSDADAGDDTTPQIATDKQNNWLAGWTSTDDRDGSGVDADLLFVPFTFLPDCNANGVSDIQDLLNGLTDACLTPGGDDNGNDNTPDDNGNDNVPDDNVNDNTPDDNANDNTGGVDDLLPGIAPPCGFGMLGTFAILTLGLGLIRVTRRRGVR